MLERTQYLAIVPSARHASPSHQLYIWNDLHQRISFQLSFESPILRALISKNYIIVVLNSTVHLYAFSSPPQFLSKYDTAPNPFGLCASGPTSFAFPGRKAGHVMIVDFQNRKGDIVPAHGGPLRALAISPDGEYLATASEKGTLIRLWSLQNGARITEFRRGVDPADIFSLAFSKTSQFLAVTSDKGTLHIFEMLNIGEPIDDSDALASETGSVAGPRSPRNTISRSSSYETLPTINTTYAPSSSIGSGVGGERRNKWNFLSKMPMAPRIFKDNYSTCSCAFSVGNEQYLRQDLPDLQSLNDSASTVKASTAFARRNLSRPPKGVIGWLSDEALVVVGTGEDARWERFVLGWGEGGKREVTRDGWRRYLES